MIQPPDPIARGIDARLEPFLAATTLVERTDAFVALVRWTRRDWDADPAVPHARRWSRGDIDRLDGLLRRLEADDELRRRFQAAIGAVFSEADGTNLFAHAGIPSERGFLAELGERLMGRVLPRPRDDRDLATLLRRLFRNEADVERLARMPNPLFGRLAALLFPADHPEAMTGLRRSFVSGFRLLAVWIQAQGLSPKMRKRSAPCELLDSPFHRIASASEAVAARWASGAAPFEEAETWRREHERCREAMAEVHRRIEREGVSTHVVYGLEVLERCLSRMHAMVEIMAPRRHGAPWDPLHRFVTSLARSVQQDRSARHLVSWNTHLLQRRIVERSGRTGEHYIATTRSEYRHMWFAAAGGGLLTVGTAAVKTVISGWHAPDFVHGVLYGLNYAASFLLLQHLGLVLATKQPAMTGATLATIVREHKGSEREDEITTYAVRIGRSQLAAALGNVIVVSAGAVGLVFLWSTAFGRPFLAEEEARTVYRQLSPVNSGTVFYAALTGVILWMASVIGGWFDNFCAYHRLPLAVAQHPAGNRLGRERMERWGDALARNASGWAANVSLGFLLGMTPAIGHFLGLPLDVRHVTLNSGILSLAGASLGVGWLGEGMFLRGAAGVAVMFVLNLAVSFLLAVTTAARAYEMPMREVLGLFRGLGRRFLRSPLEFFLPPRAP